MWLEMLCRVNFLHSVPEIYQINGDENLPLHLHNGPRMIQMQAEKRLRNRDSLPQERGFHSATAQSSSAEAMVIMAHTYVLHSCMQPRKQLFLVTSSNVQFRSVCWSASAFIRVTSRVADPILKFCSYRNIKLRLENQARWCLFWLNEFTCPSFVWFIWAEQKSV